MKEIRIGLIGAGWMGKAHTTAFHNARMIFGDDMPVFELVSDVSEQQVSAFAKQMGYNRYTTDWMEVVTDPSVDLIDVATPNCMHFEMAKAALEHGKHVFCEKPLSLSAEQSRILADLAKEKGVVNYCGFSNIMNPANQYVAELVHSGKEKQAEDTARRLRMSRSWYTPASWARSCAYMQPMIRTCCSTRPFRWHGAISTSWQAPAHSATCAAICCRFPR